MTSGSGIQNPESGATRGAEFADSRLGPVAALLSLFGTCSFLGTVYGSSSAPLPLLLVIVLAVISCLFYLVALMTSSIAFLELLAAGVSKAGKLNIAGVRIEGNPLGLIYLVAYLLPWSLILFAIVFGVLLKH